MPCFYPLPATQMPGGEILVHSRVQALERAPTPAHMGRDIKLPCGKCIGCRLQRSQDWATRCLHESQLYDQNCFLTLTYGGRNYRKDPERVFSTVGTVEKPEILRDLSTGSNIAQDAPNSGANIAPEGLWANRSNLAKPAIPGRIRSKLDRSLLLAPEGGEATGLSKKDHKKFIKRMRHKCGPLRFYMCGEYGEKLGRPHYHYLIFGYNFPDRKFFKTSTSGEHLFRSAMLDELWPYGHAWIGDVTYQSCAYVAAYVMKKITGEKAWDHYRRTDDAGNDYWLEPEFNLMSRRPGIGRDWWDQFRADVYTDDIVVRGMTKARPPRYYDKLLELFDPVTMAVVKMNREHRAKDLADDNTPARLEAKETVAKARLTTKKRQLETP